jgi:hypothetical protein
MNDRYDLVTGRKYKTRDGQEKTAWTRVGTMFARDKGGFSIQLESIPLNFDEKGGVRLMAFPPKDRDERGGGGGGRSGGSNGYSEADYGGRDDSDQVPF